LASAIHQRLSFRENSVIIASQIPFAWLAFYDGGHAFLFQEHKKFAETLDVFLK
jgi:hypothetical protein